MATPYHTGFDHTRIADDVHFRFLRALKALGRRASDLPIYGLGHSLGSTIHLLLASRYVVNSAGNVLLSYNNNSGTAEGDMTGFRSMMGFYLCLRAGASECAPCLH